MVVGPPLLELWIDQAVAYEHFGDLELAVSCIQRAVILWKSRSTTKTEYNDDNDETVVLRLHLVAGDIFAQVGEVPRALRHYEWALLYSKIHARIHALVWNHVANCQLELGRLDDALRSYERAYSLFQEKKEDDIFWWEESQSVVSRWRLLDNTYGRMAAPSA